MSYQQLGEYRRECKLALREIWLLIHPDKLAQYPPYGQLTKNQKKLLDDLWHRAMIVRAGELGFEPGFLGAEYRSLAVLRDVIETVQHILTHVGINTDVNLIVKGDTVEQQIEWLKHSIRRLEGELDSVQVEPHTHYERRRPETTVLHTLVREPINTFLAQVKTESGTVLPNHVEKEFDDYLRSCAAACWRMAFCGYAAAVAAKRNW